MTTATNSSPTGSPPHLKNWAGNVTFSPAQVLTPTTTAELCALVASTPNLRVLGSGHSFTPLAATRGTLLRLHALTDLPPPSLDEATGVIWVPGHLTYGTLVDFLRSTAWAPHNLASLPHITIAGTIATATHGSGTRNGNLSTAVVGLEMVNAEGQLVRVSAATHGVEFAGMVVALGSLGVVLRVGLQLVPAFALTQTVYEGLQLETACERLREVLEAGYSVSLFTTWRGPLFEQVWRKRRATEGEAPAQWLGATRATKALHPIPGVPANPCTPQLGKPGPAAELLPHFRFEFQPSAGEELQTEYFVAMEHAPAALRAVATLRDAIAPLLHVCEVRAVAKDELWLSMAQGRDSVAIHFTWRLDVAAVNALLPRLEAVLAPFEPRPHWGKLFLCKGAELAGRYPYMGDFLRLRKAWDPKGKFCCEWFDGMLDPAARL